MRISYMLILVGTSLLGKASSNCQYRTYEECHHKIGQSFRDFRASGGTDIEAEHCAAFQTLIACLEKDKHCSGDFLDEFRFVILNVGIISKKMFCTDMDYNELKDMVQGVKDKMGVPDIEPLPASDCAKALFRDCYLNKFAQSMAKNHNVCKNVDALVECLEKATACNSTLMKVYTKILEIHGEHVTRIAEENKNDFMMCQS